MDGIYLDLLLRFAANSLSATLDRWMRGIWLSCGLRPIRCLLHYTGYQGLHYQCCGLRPIRCLLHSFQEWAMRSHCCGLRPIRCLLHYQPFLSFGFQAAVCGQFAVCYTVNQGYLSWPRAAVCGQFAVCYTPSTIDDLAITAAVCGQFAVCYTDDS